MSSFAVFIFLFWNSFIACWPIFVYFPLFGISLLSSVSPLYSIFDQFVFWFLDLIVLWFLLWRLCWLWLFLWCCSCNH